MKRAFITFDQSTLHAERRKQERRDNLAILAFATFLLIVGTGALVLCLRIAAKIVLTN